MASIEPVAPRYRWPGTRPRNAMEWLQRQFELSRGAADNVRAMEGLRGIAVFLVFLVHYSSLVGPWLPAHSATTSIAGSLKTLGQAGVDLFFVLSGYLIYGTLISRHQPFFRFILRRIQRIYPTFAVVFVLYIGLSFAVPSQRKIPASLGGGLLYLLKNFFLLPGLFPIVPMITVAWSLSYEIFFYLALPLIIGVLALRARQPWLRATVFGALALGLATYCALFGGPVRLIMFVAGILLYEVIKSRAFSALGSIVATGAFFGGLLFLLLPLQGDAGFAVKTVVLLLCFFVFCHTCFTRAGSPIGTIISWTPVRWLGNMSYSYYLIHGLALKACFMALAKVFPHTDQHAIVFWLILLPAFAATLAASTVLFLLIERPLSLAPVLNRKLGQRPLGDPIPVDGDPTTRSNSAQGKQMLTSR